MDIYEREILIEALKRTGGNVSKAAANLGTTARIFGYKAKKLGIDYHKYRRNK